MPRGAIDTKNSAKPWVSNYPELEAWLEKIGARCMHQEKFGFRDMIEMWTANGRNFFVLVHGGGNGWNIFTDGDSGKIVDTLKDAEERLRWPAHRT